MSTAQTPQSTHTETAPPMADTEPQIAAGKVLWHFTMSLDGFVAGPDHGMDWMTGASFRPGLVEEYAETTGAVLGGRDGFEVRPDGSGIYGGAWQGPVFVLTHLPDDARATTGVTFLNCDVAEAVRIGLEAAGGKNLEVFSPTIGRQLLERELIDEIDLHIAPVLLGDGIRLFDNPGGAPVRLELLNGDDRSGRGERAVSGTRNPMTQVSSGALDTKIEHPFLWKLRRGHDGDFGRLLMVKCPSYPQAGRASGRIVSGRR
nr:dihydrofolate reductase family protein [Streptomyces sp. NBC_00886]